MKSWLRTGIVFALSAVAAACNGGGGGPAAPGPVSPEPAEATTPPATQTPVAASPTNPPAAGSPEAVLKESKEVAKATVTALVNAATTPEMKAALTDGLKVIDTLPSKESVEVFEKAFEAFAARDVAHVKQLTNLGTVFQLQGDPNVAPLDLATDSFALAEFIPVNRENIDTIRNNLAQALLAILPMSREYHGGGGIYEGYALAVYYMFPTLFAGCLLTPCEGYKVNVLAANVIVNFYNAELKDYMVHLGERSDIERALGILYDDMFDQFKREEKSVPVNYFAELTDTRRKIRAPNRIGGTLSAGGSVKLKLNDNHVITVASSGSFSFGDNKVDYGLKYKVAVEEAPAGQTCAVVNGEGRARADISNIVVTCTNPAVAVGGSVSGLTDGKTVSLRLNDGTAAGVGNGNFTFSQTVTSGSNYTVTATAPNGFECSVANGSGSATAAVTNVTVTCSLASKTVTVGVSGWASGLELYLNGVHTLAVTGNGSTSFTQRVPVGNQYAVTVKTNPAGKSCSVTNGSGTAASDSDINVTVNCVTLRYTVGGTASGSVASTLILRLSPGNIDKSITGSGAFTFGTEVDHGTQYTIAVHQQPTGRTCSVQSGGSGTLTANVSNLSVSCVLNTYTIGGTISGLGGGTIVLTTSNNSLQSVTTSPFTFTNPVDHGTTYTVSIATHPAGKKCYIVAGQGGTLTANTSNIQIACLPDSSVKRIYVSNAVAGSFANNAAADAVCTSAPDAIAGSKALLAIGTTRVACTSANCVNATGTSENTDWPLKANYAYVNSGGDLIAFSNENAIFAFPLYASLNTTVDNHWTGLADDWTTSDTCTNWSGTGMAKSGLTNTGTTSAISFAMPTDCTESHPLICVEQ